MSDKDLFEQSKRIAMFVAGAQDPCDAMQAVIAAMFEDKVPGDDMFKIMAGTIIHMARTLDTAALSTLDALVKLLILLYPDKPLDDITALAADLMKPESERRPQVTKHVFIFQRRSE